jgi:DNA invertase Pin-like site-specific DNA recombinase
VQSRARFRNSARALLSQSRLKQLTQSVAAPIVPVAIYTRVSTLSQVGGRFDSCESQAAVCRDYVRKNIGWHEVACYTDAAYSGGTMNRPGIRALQRQIEAGEVKVVLIYKLERMLRSTDEWAPFRALLKQHGCRLVSTTEDLSDETPSGRLKNNLLVSVAEYERLNTAEKIRGKLLEQAKRGMWNGGATPYGYVYVPASKTLGVDEKEAAIVREIFQRVSQFESLHDIADDLNRRAVTTRVRKFCRRSGEAIDVGGKGFRTDVLRKMICRPVYAGRVKCGLQDFPGMHQAIVSSQLWELANAAVEGVLKGQQRKQREQDKHFHLLKGLAVCGTCRSQMIPAPSGKRHADGRPFRYYVCGRDRHLPMRRDCAVRHISADVLERAVLDFLQKCALHPDVIEKVVTKYESRRGIDGANLRAKLRAVEGTLQEVGTKLRHCADLLTQGGLDSLTEEIRANAGLLHDEKRGLLIERELLTRELDSKVVDPEHVRLALGRLGDLVEKLAGTERKKLVATFLSRVEVHPARGLKEIPGKRTVDVVVLLRLPQLVTGMSEGLIIDETSKGRDDSCAALRFRISFNSTRAKRSIAIVAPFSADTDEYLRAPGDIGIVATLERALEWQKRLHAQSDLKRTTLAAEAGISPATVTQTLKLAHLDPEIIRDLLSRRRNASFNELVRLSKLAAAEQRQRWCEAVE